MEVGTTFQEATANAINDYYSKIYMTLFKPLATAQALSLITTFSFTKQVVELQRGKQWYLRVM